MDCVPGTQFDTLTQPEISRGVPNGREFAGSVVGARSPRRLIWSRGNFGRAVSGLEIRLPGNGDYCRQRRGSNVRLPPLKPKHQVLARPFGGQIAKPDYSHSVWKQPVNGCLDEVGRKEGERDRHVHFPLPSGTSLSEA